MDNKLNITFELTYYFSMESLYIQKNECFPMSSKFKKINVLFSDFHDGFIEDPLI